MGAILFKPGQTAVASRNNASEFTKDVLCIFECPICCENYDSHIIQCQSGHSICDNCAKRLHKCPQCNARYNGTRNYALEDILAQLQRAKTTPKKIVDDVLYATEARANAARQQNVVTTGVITVTPVVPKKKKETTVCRMNKCRQFMPLDDLQGHLKSAHNEDVYILNGKTKWKRCRFGFKGNSLYNQRYALLTDIGIFFLIVRIEIFVEDGDDMIRITAWIQGTCKPEVAHRYYSLIEIEFNGTRATYQDYVHGDLATVAEIEDNDECLKFSVYNNHDDDIEIDISGFVSYNMTSNRDKDRPRRQNTNIVDIESSEQEEEDDSSEDGDYYQDYYYD
uniref:Putative e3 ubiquitin-protein ligase sina n=1 Tax=Nyssomyia neivai TaxID=330878 RepID=A0A1L8DT89_9DIPT